MKILFNFFIRNFCHKEILVNVTVRNFKSRELTIKRMAIIPIEFPVMLDGIFAHTRENRARWRKKRGPADESARSKFHFNPEIPRHIMATLLSLSFRFPLSLSLFISFSFFFFAIRRAASNYGCERRESGR